MAKSAIACAPPTGDESAVGEALTIDADEFQQRARGLGIHDFTDFYKSDQFIKNGFEYDEQSKQLTRVL